MSHELERNPGPSWGFDCLRACCRILPLPLVHVLSDIGSMVAWLGMKAERQASLEYLAVLHDRKVRLGESVAQFCAFTRGMLAKLRAGEGASVSFDWDTPEDAKEAAVLFGKGQLLLGTFHVGGSEFLGFHGLTETRQVAMVRQRRENAGDIEALTENSVGKLRIVWTQDGEPVTFAIRDLIAEGYSLAMQCDRVEHASKTAAFEFLGAKRQMPITIYRLAMLYQLPVSFCVALPEKDTLRFRVKAYPAFLPPTGTRKEAMAAAQCHFQDVLYWLENILKDHPQLWFNFIPLEQLAPTAR